MIKLPLTRGSILTLLLAANLSAHADVTLFRDSFESGNLDRWTGQSGGPNHGAIVPDPLNPANHVLTFSAVDFGGDLFSATDIPLTGPRRFVLSFDFLGLPVGGVPPSEYGGFAGISTALNDADGPLFWLAGTYAPEISTLPAVGAVLVADGAWHHYEIDFTDVILANQLSAIHVVLEDWAGLGSVPGDVFFDNVRVVGVLDVGVFANLVPCAGPVSGGVWKNHGQYVAAMSKVVQSFLAARLITVEEAVTVLSAAARSDCGKH